MRSGPNWLPIVLVLILLPASPARSQAGSPGGGSAAATHDPSDWKFALRPYFYMTGLSGSVTAEPITVPINSRIGDLLDNVKLAGFVAFTAEKGQWGFYVDIEYMSLSGQGYSALQAELKLENLIGEADVGFSPGGSQTLKFLAGVRVHGVQQTLRIQDDPSSEAETTVIDPILGAQGFWPFTDRWNFLMRGDIGGFGVSSEFTYQLLTLFRYDISEIVSVPFGYRILGYQIQDGDVWMNTRMGGLVLGMGFTF